MNPAEQIIKRRDKAGEAIGGLCFERYQLAKQQEAIAVRLTELDAAIERLQAGIEQCEHARRDFDTYLAVTAHGITGDQLNDAIKQGKDINLPPGSVQNNPQQTDSKDNKEVK